MGSINSILQMSLTGSVLFLILCIFKPFTQRIFSATWNYYMLFITILVFLLPIGSFVRLPQVVNYKDYMPIQDTSKVLQLNKENIEKQDDEIGDDQILQNNDKLKPTNINQVNLEKSKTSSQVFTKEMLFYLWILGAIMFLGKEVYVARVFYKKLKNVSNIIEENSIINVLETCKKKLNISRRIVLKECSVIKSPMITGILTPVITIPKMNTDLDKLEIILDHELIHHKRKDLLVKTITLIANIINWFNPIIYVIRTKMNVICELSLDEQLIKNMDKSKRKYYGEIILELIEYAQNKSLSLGASIYKSRKELETRLKKIVFFKKSRKIIVCMSLIATIFFTTTSLFAVNTVFAESNVPLINARSTEFAVFASKDGLYMSNLKENNPSLLDKSEKIKLPIISRDGLFVAYIKEDNLYICNIKSYEITEVAKNIESYDWNNSGNLIYSIKNTGMSMYNPNTKSSTTIIDNEYNYYNITCDSKNKIYANKNLEYTKGNDHYSKSIGIITYDFDNKEEKILLESKEGNDKEIEEPYTVSKLLESLGSTPNVSKVSNDDRYLYIWNAPKSGSTAADITEFTVYDLLNNKFIENDNMVALAYKNNISQNPIDSNLIAVNKGEDREMYHDKTLGIFNVENNTFKNLLPEDQVSMMPDYSEDGKNIVYSGTNNLKNQQLKTVGEWFDQPHYIYQVNVDTEKVTQITNSNSCDFMPKYLLNNEILFVRQDGDSYSLWKTKDGVETKLAESLNFNSTSYTNTWYYGHYKTEMVIDVFVK